MRNFSHKKFTEPNFILLNFPLSTLGLWRNLRRLKNLNLDADISDGTGNPRLEELKGETGPREGSSGLYISHKLESLIIYCMKAAWRVKFYLLCAFLLKLNCK